jgi:thiamine pyrophosphate-dependent acetolactate synthase large subunit-like protein
VDFTVADYILKRLSEQKVDRLFGVPAAYCAPLFDAAPGHGIKSIVAASDLEAGYAADGYARSKGLGAVSVAYGVGTLSTINAIAGAYVERSPVVVINGGPTAANIANLHQFDIVFSHSVGQDATDLAAHKLVTAKAVRARKASEGCDPVIVVIANGIHGYEQFLVDPSFFDNATNQPPSYAVLNQWDFVKFAGGLGLQFAQAVDTAAALDAALAAAKAFNGPALIAATVDPHGLPAELP